VRGVSVRETSATAASLWRAALIDFSRLFDKMRLVISFPNGLG